MHRLRRWALDAFLTGLAAVEAVAILARPHGSWPAAAVTAAAALVLVARRWHPLVISLLSLLGCMGGLMLAGDSPDVQFFGLLATFAVVAGVNSTRAAAAAWACGAACIGFATWKGDGPGWFSDYLLTLALCTLMWVAGYLVSRRTRHAELMHQRAQLAEFARARAVRDERDRLARELHDVVSHGLSVVVLQTVAARAALADHAAEIGRTAPPDVERRLDAVEETARDALAEMRRMLDLLQTEELSDLRHVDASATGSAPTPSLTTLPVLVERARAAGLTVEQRVEVAATLSPGLELAAYRVVQEALTNAVKHAPGARVRVDVTDSIGELLVVVADDGGGPLVSARTDLAGGAGLAGMRARVALYGGALQAGALGSGGFSVRASMPLPTASPEPASSPPLALQAQR